MLRCAILAGPNGAGKSTTAPQLVQSMLGIADFVNAAFVAQGLAGNGTGPVAVRAGRLMSQRLRELSEAKTDFAFETNLASRSWAPFVRALQECGYAVSLFCFALPTAESALARVASRVLEGGHTVDEAIVRRRFTSGRRLFLDLYRQLVDDWRVFDASQFPPKLIASGDRSGARVVLVPAVWKAFEQP